jgi:hypothetical protein
MVSLLLVVINTLLSKKFKFDLKRRLIKIKALIKSLFLMIFENWDFFSALLKGTTFLTPIKERYFFKAALFYFF